MTTNQPQIQTPESKWRYVALFGVDLDRIVNVLEFFKIPFIINPDNLSNFDIVISYHDYVNPLSVKGPILCIPSDTEEFYNFLEGLNVKADCVQGQAEINLRIKKGNSVSLFVSQHFFYTGSVDALVSFEGIPILAHAGGTNVNILSVDLADEINQLTELGIDLKPTAFFKFSSELNLANLIPRRLGDTLLKSMADVDLSTENFQRYITSLDGLRFLLLAVLAISAKKPLRTLGFWKNDARYALMITHDVDTKFGFKVGIGRLREVEKKYNIKSAWNIPADHFALDSKVLDMLLADGCEIGSHGFHHVP